MDLLYQGGYSGHGSDKDEREKERGGGDEMKLEVDRGRTDRAKDENVKYKGKQRCREMERKGCLSQW